MWIGIDTIENIMHISQKIKNGSAIVVVQSLSHVWLCDPMNCSTPGFPVCHYLPEFAQTHSHWVSDAMQPSHPLLPPSPLTLNLSQHQVLFNELTLCISWPKYWKCHEFCVDHQFFNGNSGRLYFMGCPGGSEVKASAWNSGDPGSIPGSGRSPGEGNGNDYSILAWEIAWAEEPGRVRHDWNGGRCYFILEASKTTISNPERLCYESATLNMPANLENSAVATGLEKVSFHSNPKERQCQRMLKLPHNCTHLTR